MINYFFHMFHSRRHTFLLNMLAIITPQILTSVVLFSNANAETPEQRFRREYPKAAADLEAYYSQIRGWGTLTSLGGRDGDPPSISETIILRFAVNEGRCLTDYTVTETSGGSLPKGFRSVGLAEPSRLVLLKNTGEGTPLTIQLVQSIAPKDENTIHLNYRHDYIDRPFYLAMDYLVDYLKTGYQIDKIEERDHSIVRVYFRRPHRADEAKIPDLKGHFDLRSDQSWILSSYEFSSGNGETYSGTVNYQIGKDGVPLPTKCNSSIRYQNGISSQETFVYDEIEHAPTPPEEFTLAAFGFPEIDTPRNPRAGWRGEYSFFVVAVGALAGAFGLRWLGRCYAAA